MTNGLIETAAQTEAPADRRIYGITVAQVVNNIDQTGLGRVQVHLPWLPGINPWARVAVPMAGSSRGTFFIPQIGDEVLVAFNHGDIREAYVVGSLWNGRDKPPTEVPAEATTKRIIRTPVGHEIEFDDLAQSITITSKTEQQISIDPKRIEIKTTKGTATLAMDTQGNITIEAAVGITLKAKTITLQGTKIDIKSDASTSINGGAACNIKGSTVQIN